MSFTAFLNRPLRPAFMVGWCGLMLMLLTVFILRQPSALIGDEPLHLQGAKLLVEGMPFKTMLQQPLGSAPGPLYQLLHAALSPVTDIQAPGVRLVNVVLLAGLLGLLALLIRTLDGATPPWAAGTLLAVPIVWQFAGLALTEIPALVVAVAACVVWFRGKGWGSAVAAGFLLGMAVCGRQTLLVLVVGLLATGTLDPRQWRRQWLLMAALAPLPLLLFLTWGGLTPAGQDHLAGLGVGNACLAWIWLSIYGLILAPRWVSIIPWRRVLLLGVGVTLINVITGWFSLPVWTRVLQHYLDEDALALLARINGGVLAAVALVFAVATASRIWPRRHEPVVRYWIVATLAITSTALAIGGHFSPRYPGLATPFLVGLLSSELSPTPLSLLRWTLGACLGLVSVGSYF